MIKFSVILPLYNKEKEIANTLKSVLNQTYKADEIIVVDDGSTDNSKEVVKKFKDVKLIEQKNCGVSCARNRGIKEARNEYICFLDADDLWEEDFLEEIKRLIESFPQAIFYSTSHKMIDENGKVINDGLPKDVLLKTNGSHKFSFEGKLLDIIKVDVEDLGIEIDFAKSRINTQKIEHIIKAI